MPIVYGKRGLFSMIFGVRSANLVVEDSQMRDSHAKSLRAERSVSLCIHSLHNWNPYE